MRGDDVSLCDFWQDLFRRNGFTFTQLARARAACRALRSIVDAHGRAIAFVHQNGGSNDEPARRRTPPDRRFEFARLEHRCRREPMWDLGWVTPDVRHLMLTCWCKEHDPPIQLPDCIERLVTGGLWDTFVRYPPGLRELHIVYSFQRAGFLTQTLPALTQLVLGPEMCVLPDLTMLPSLRTLVIGDSFVDAIAGLATARSLRTLIVGNAFDQPIPELGSLRSLRFLSLGDRFDQTLDALANLTSLRVVSIGDRFDRALPDLTPLWKLRRLSVGRRFDRPLPKLPRSLATLELGHERTPTMHDRDLAHRPRNVVFGARSE